MLRDAYVIWSREMKKFLAHKIEIVAGLIWPLFLIFMLGIGMSSFADIKNLGISYTLFLGPGILAIMSVGWGMSEGMNIIEDKKKLVKRLLVAPINRFSILVGKILATLTTQAIMMTVVIFVLMLYNNFSLPKIFLTIFLLLLISAGFAGFGLLLASFFTRARAYQQISGFLMWVAFFLSGALFPITNLPVAMKYVTYINPLTYGVDFVRWSMIGLHEINLIIDILVVSLFSIVVIVYGSYLFNKNLRK